MKGTDIFKYYTGFNWLDKFYLRARYYAFPYFETLEQEVPKHGNILDWGCGLGFFSLYMAESSGYRKITAADIDSRKIDALKRAMPKKNITFSYIRDFAWENNKFDAVILLDVAYYMDTQEYLELLSALKQVLKSDGIFLVKNLYKSNNWKHKYTEFQETLTKRITKQTISTGLHFRTIEEDFAVFGAAGLNVVKSQKLGTILPYLHILYKLNLSK
ncbi:MAG: class I SAM-dependent methyltransferase [Ferruginibacter sp.]